ncbi:hypothetical protein P43SY_007952 [Pythium insidiosum]|uniref:Cyclic nucleotide-binding domain-containing protein n=1 Tax=Pythium insidiosum TaxID=114742 RepID=A0AAD5Q4C9_PYTIN|nr:hypothetical protein P43SY_007952 [Pythium insidiosum]
MPSTLLSSRGSDVGLPPLATTFVKPLTPVEVPATHNGERSARDLSHRSADMFEATIEDMTWLLHQSMRSDKDTGKAALASGRSSPRRRARPPRGKAARHGTEKESMQEEKTHTSDDSDEEEDDEEYGSSVENSVSSGVTASKTRRQVAALSHRAYAEFRLGRFQQAIKDYTACISSDPTSGVFFYNRGCAFYASRRRERALQDFTLNNAQALGQSEVRVTEDVTVGILASGQIFGELCVLQPGQSSQVTIRAQTLVEVLLLGQDDLARLRVQYHSGVMNALQESLLFHNPPQQKILQLRRDLAHWEKEKQGVLHELALQLPAKARDMLSASLGGKRIRNSSQGKRSGKPPTSTKEPSKAQQQRRRSSLSPLARPGTGTLDPSSSTVGVSSGTFRLGAVFSLPTFAPADMR